MMVKLSFLNDFNCTYTSALPICSDEEDTQIGTCKMSVQNNKYVGDLIFDHADYIHKDYYLWCKWHIAENDLLMVDKLYLTKETLDPDFSFQLKDAISAD